MNVAIQLLMATISTLLRGRDQEDISNILDAGLAFWRRGVSGRAGILQLNAQIQAMVDEDRGPTVEETSAQSAAIEAAEDAVLDADLDDDT